MNFAKSSPIIRGCDIIVMAHVVMIAIVFLDSQASFHISGGKGLACGGRSDVAVAGAGDPAGEAFLCAGVHPFEGSVIAEALAGIMDGAGAVFSCI